MKVSPRDIIRFFWQSARRYPGTLVFMAISAIGLNALEVFTPLCYKKFFDIVTNQEGVERGVLVGTLLGMLGTIFILKLVSWFFYRSADFSNNRLSTRVRAELKERAFDNLIHHSYGFFANNFGGSLVERLHRIAKSFETIIDRMYWGLLPLALQLVGITYVFWMHDPVFAYILLAWTALFIIINVFLSFWKMKYDMLRAQKASIASGVLADSITNHQTVQLFAREEEEFNRFKKVNRDVWNQVYFNWNLGAGIDAIQALLFIGIEIVLMYVAIGFWEKGIVTAGFFLLLQVYIVRLLKYLWDFGRALRGIYEGFADAEEIVSIMNLRPDILDVPNAKNLSIKKGEITFNRVSFSYQKTRKALRTISLTIKSGERVALIGSSGAGKSTFVKLLLRCYDPESGTISIDGQNIRKVTQKSLRENIGFVPQEPILFHRSLMENIRYGNISASDEEVRIAAQRAHCDEFIDVLPDGYDTLVGERGVKLSGGERQRVAIARVIVKDAPILILDEATSSLDSHSENLIQRAFDHVMKGKTTIAIAHRLSTIKKMDRIIVIEGGIIIEEGSHTQLLKKPKSIYRGLWKLQSGGFLLDIE